MRKYLMTFDEKDKDKGVFAMSLVSNPAMESEWVALKNEPLKLKGLNKKEGILLGVAMIPNKPIYRNDENGEYLIEFSNDSIKNIAHQFVKRGNVNNSTVEHELQLGKEVVNVVESWLIEDDVHDKTRLHGIKEPVGSWAVKMKVNDPELYEKAANGELKGISIEGFFDKKLVTLNNDENMSKSIADEIKEGFSEIAKLFKKEQKATETKLGSATLEDGETVVQYEGESLEAGISATVNGEPVPVGTHVTQDGMTIVVEEAGTIASVSEAEAENEEEVDAEKEQIKSAIIEAVTSLKKEFETKLSETKAEIKKEYEAKLSEQSKQIQKLSNVEQPTIKKSINLKQSNAELNNRGRLLQKLRNK